MDIKKYISSGILEQYVFGLLSAPEAQEVEQLLSKHPELRKELTEIEYAMEAYASGYREKISPEFYQNLQENLKDITPDPAPSAPPTLSGGSNSNFINNKILGGLLALSVLGGVWLFFQNQAHQTDKETAELAYTRLEQNCADIQNEKLKLDTVLQTIRRSGSLLIQMGGTDFAPEALAAVFWNGELEESYLDVINLTPPPAGQQYQLWAIVDGTPQDMGVFEVSLDTIGLQKIPFVANAQAFAVTLEPAGGSEFPTLDQMVVVGTAAG